MRIDIEPEIELRINKMVEASEGIAPVSAESIVHMALEAFLEGAGM